MDGWIFVSRQVLAQEGVAHEHPLWECGSCGLRRATAGSTHVCGPIALDAPGVSGPLRLWLDDERLPPQGWTWARNCRDAIALVVAALADGGGAVSNESHPFQEASLDHDLGSGQATGMDFVEWMAKVGAWPAHQPTVHSANPDGRLRMRELVLRGPYCGGLLTSVIHHRVHTTPDFSPRSSGVQHDDCSDPACCNCSCNLCFETWRQAQRPLPQDCEELQRALGAKD